MNRHTFRLLNQTRRCSRALAGILLAAASNAAYAGTYTNPIIGAGADPWVVQYKGQYFYARSAGGQIFVDRATDLQGIGTGTGQFVYKPPAGTAYSKNVWAPELHYLDDKWYIYFAADDGDNANHRMYVLESTSKDPQGPYTFKGKIAAATDRWAIDGTVMQHNGSNYFVWSGWQGTTDGRQDLYIAQMSNPWTITGDRVRISTPVYDWEKHGLSLNEGPTMLKKDGQLHIIYSGSGFWRPEYALGQLTLTGGNPMSAASWTKKNTPVFSRTSNVVGTGHASFVKSPDQGEDWIVYHAHNDPNVWTGGRDVRIQEFGWNADGSPNFGSPIDSGQPTQGPSGRAAVTYIANHSFERADVSVTGSGFGVDRMRNTGNVGVIDNQGRFFTPIAGGEGRQVGYVASSGVNGVSYVVGDIVKPGTYGFSAGLAISSDQAAAAAAAPTTYELRLESVGRTPGGAANEADKVLLGSTTVTTNSLGTAVFNFFNTFGTIPLLSDRYNTSLRLGIFSTGVGGGNWQAKVENLDLTFTPAARPAAPTPVAYWRFEEGVAGVALTGTDGDNALPHTTTADSADGDDALRATSGASSPRFSADTAVAVVPNTGEINRYSFEFSPNQDAYTKLPGDLQNKSFSAFTIEASFKLDTLDRWQGIVGKDGKPTPLGIAPLQLKARNDNDRIQIEIIDGSGKERQVSGVDALSANQWFHVAAVNDGTTLSLYLDRGDGAGYVLQGTTGLTGGALFDSAGLWSVGRGMYNGAAADWLDGKIDEVRISDVALDPTQFLFFDPAGMPSWNVNAGGAWGDQGNWSRATPNSVNAVANFTDAITAARTVTVDAAQTVAAINFRNSSGYTIGGPGSLVVDTNGSAGAINVARGSHTIEVPVTFNRNTTLAVTPADATLTLSGDMSAVASAVLTKTGLGALRVKHVRAGSLAVNAGRVQVLPDGTAGATSRVTMLAIAAGGRLDLTDNDMVIDYAATSPAETVRQYLFDGRAGGSWAGTTGILSSAAAADPQRRTTIGYLENSLFGATTFSGQLVDATALLLKYTWYGDANLDGRIGVDDYTRLDRGFARGLSGWGNGDFDYNGTVNAADYFLIDTVFGVQNGSLTPEFLAGRQAQFGDAYVATLVATVPEPAGTALVAVAGACVLSRGRRRP
jgi:GH43 family beta-xylosidase